MSGSEAALAAIAAQLGQVMGVLEKQVSRTGHCLAAHHFVFLARAWNGLPRVGPACRSVARLPVFTLDRGASPARVDDPIEVVLPLL